MPRNRKKSGSEVLPPAPKEGYHQIGERPDLTEEECQKALRERQLSKPSWGPPFSPENKKQK